MSDSKAKETKSQHIHMLMTPSEAKAIDDWGFANRIRTRAEAIRRLCEIGLLADERIDTIEKAAEASKNAIRDMAYVIETVGAARGGVLTRETFKIVKSALDLAESAIGAHHAAQSLIAVIAAIKNIPDPTAATEAQFEALTRELDDLRNTVSKTVD